MRRFWVPTIVLGAAGFDPVGAFTFIGAAALGAVKRNLAVLALTSVLTSWVLSMVAVLGLGDAIHSLMSHVHLHPSHQQTSWALLLGGLILLGWGIWRFMSWWNARALATDVAAGGGAHVASTHREGRTPRSVTASGMATAGLLVGLSTLVDPAWYAMIAFASTLRHRAEAIACGTVWTVMSHSLLIVLALSLLFGWYEPLHRLLDRLQTRYREELSLLITALLGLAGVAGIALGILRLFGVIAGHHHHHP